MIFKYLHNHHNIFKFLSSMIKELHDEILGVSLAQLLLGQLGSHSSKSFKEDPVLHFDLLHFNRLKRNNGYFLDGLFELWKLNCCHYIWLEPSSLSLRAKLPESSTHLVFSTTVLTSALYTSFESPLDSSLTTSNNLASLCLTVSSPALTNLSPAGWDKVFEFVGGLFIHLIFRPKQREANATYLVVYPQFVTIRNIKSMFVDFWTWI